MTDPKSTDVRLVLKPDRRRPKRYLEMTLSLELWESPIRDRVIRERCKLRGGFDFEEVEIVWNTSELIHIRAIGR